MPENQHQKIHKMETKITAKSLRRMSTSQQPRPLGHSKQHTKRLADTAQHHYNGTPQPPLQPHSDTITTATPPATAPYSHHDTPPRPHNNHTTPTPRLCTAATMYCCQSCNAAATPTTAHGKASTTGVTFGRCVLRRPVYA